MAIPTTHLFLLARTCRLSLFCTSPSISPFYFYQNLATLTHVDNTSVNAHSPNLNLFAEFATTEFNLSSADIAGIFKIKPSLERLKTLKKVERVVDMLKTCGCTQHQITFVMKRQPNFLTVCPEKLIEPKILFLRDLGIHGDDLAKVVARTPRIFTASLQCTLIPNAAFLQDIFKTQELFIKTILRIPSVLTYDLEKYLKPSFAFFDKYDLGGEQLFKLILSRPGLLHCTCLSPAKADLLQKIGVEKGSKMYKYVFMAVIGYRLETLEAKIHNFKRCGLTVEEVMELFRVCPFVFSLSQDRVRQNMEFIVNDMELPANSLLKHRGLLLYNLKVVKPRILVLKRIQTLNNLGHLPIRGLGSILAMSEAKFVNKIIKGHPESRQLNEVYEEALTDGSATTKAGIKSSTRTWCY